MDLLRFCCLVFIHSVIVLLIFNNSYFVSAAWLRERFRTGESSNLG
ncbi:hypothetical protein CsSME_00050490 [Camellia sinensis var. sinensis]